MEEDIKELKRLFYSGRLTQDGKRQLIDYYEHRIQELKEENKRMKSLDIYKLIEDYETGQLIPTSVIEKKIKEIENKNYNDYTNLQDGNEVKYRILNEFKEILEKERDT